MISIVHRESTCAAPWPCVGVQAGESFTPADAAVLQATLDAAATLPQGCALRALSLPIALSRAFDDAQVGDCGPCVCACCTTGSTGPAACAGAAGVEPRLLCCALKMGRHMRVRKVQLRTCVGCSCALSGAAARTMWCRHCAQSSGA